MHTISRRGAACILGAALLALSACGKKQVGPEAGETSAPVPQAAQSEAFPDTLTAPSASYSGVMRFYGAGAPLDAKVFASGPKLRMEMSGGMGAGGTMAMVTDVSSRQTVMFPIGDIPEAARVAMTVALGEGGAPQLADLYGAGVTTRRIGLDMVAGQRCAVWEAADSKSETVTLSCVTSDGINMRTVNAKTNAPLMEMAQLARGPQDPGLFAPPPGYRTVAMPQLGAMPNQEQMRALQDMAKAAK